MRPVVLIVNSREPACGVHQFGVNLFNILNSVKTVYDFKLVECVSAGEVLHSVGSVNPAAIIFNYHSIVSPYATVGFIKELRRPCLGLYHEITQHRANKLISAAPFCHWISLDPTLKPNKHISVIGRPIYRYINKFKPSDSLVVGTFGFGFRNKGFSRIVDLVQAQYNTATIRAHIAFSKYCDPNGLEATKRIAEMRARVKRSEISIVGTHDLLPPLALLDFLAQNTINVFLYDDMPRGISSVIDYALAVGRPIAVNRTSMFRHIYNAKPHILVEKAPLCDIIKGSERALRPFREAWSPENLVKAVNGIVSRFL